MSLTKKQEEKLESRIAEIFSRGYVKTPQPKDQPGFDKDSSLLAAHEIVEMVSTEYFLDDKEEFSEPLIDETARKLREELAKPMNGLAGLFQASGVGGGLGVVL